MYCYRKWSTMEVGEKMHQKGGTKSVEPVSREGVSETVLEEPASRRR